MARKKLLIAFHPQNKKHADQLVRDLMPYGYQFQLFAAKYPLIQGVQDAALPTILVMSTNFFKSRNAMYEVLSWSKKLYDLNLFFPVIAPGVDADKNTELPTSFSKVSDAIRYMKYWQDEYLDLRANRRNIEGKEREKLEAKITKTKAVSTEIGDYLRFLKSIETHEITHLKTNGYRSFFDFTNDPTSKAAYAAKQSIKAKSVIIESNIDTKKTTGKIAPKVEVKTTKTDSTTTSIPDESLELDKDGIPIFKPAVIPDLSKVKIEKPTDETPKPVNEPTTVTTNEKPIDIEIANEEIEEEEPPVDIDSIPGFNLLADKKPVNEEDDFIKAIDDFSRLDDEIEVEKEVQIESKSPIDTPPVLNKADEEKLNELADEVANEPAGIAGEPLEEWSTIVDGIYEQEEQLAADIEIKEEEKEEIEEEETAADILEIDTIISQAYQYFEEEEYEDGIDTLEEGIVSFPQQVDLQYHLALSLARHQRNFDQAKKVLDRLLATDHTHEDALFLKGEIAETQENYPQAYRHFKQVADLNKNYPEVFFRLAVLTEDKLSDPEQALKYYKKAIKHQKHQPTLQYRMGVLLNEKLGQSAKSIQYFKKTLKLKPDHPFANYDLAILYHQLNDRALANIYYLKAIEINPELQTPENDVAFAYELSPTSRLNEKTLESNQSKSDLSRLNQKLATLPGGVPAHIAHAHESPKTILITGATSGIGKATALLFAEKGYKVIVTGRRADRLEALASHIKKEFDNTIHTLSFDVRNKSEVDKALKTLKNEWQNIDILLNNAGLAKGKGPIQTGKIEDWEQMIDTNIKGLLYMTRAIVPHMIKNQKGHIINIASSAGKEVYPGGNVYCATKHAVDALTRAMRIDLHHHRIRVSQVAPGMVEETEFSLVRFDGDAERAKIYDDFNPLTARDVAETILFVATRPPHVNVQDVLMFGTQQANSIYTHRSGRDFWEEK